MIHLTSLVPFPFLHGGGVVKATISHACTHVTTLYNIKILFCGMRVHSNVNRQRFYLECFNHNLFQSYSRMGGVHSYTGEIHI